MTLTTKLGMLKVRCPRPGWLHTAHGQQQAGRVSTQRSLCRQWHHSTLRSRARLVDDHDELLHAEGLGEQRVLPRLAAALVASLEFAFSGRYDEDADVGLRRALDHVGHKVLVARGVEDGVPARNANTLSTEPVAYYA